MTTPSNHDLTRQQLDELDALLQRMLAPPVASEPRLPIERPPVESLPTLEPVAQSLNANWRYDPPAEPYRQPHAASSLSPMAEMLTAGPRAEVFGSSQVERAATITRIPVPQPQIIPFPVREPAPTPAPAPSAFLPPRVPLPEVPVTPAVIFTPPTVTVMPDLPAPPAMMHEMRPETPAVQTPLSVAAETPPPLPSSFGRIDLANSPLASAPDIVIPEPPTIVVSQPTPAAESLPLLHWPLYGLNWVLESGLKTFGPIGEQLTQPSVKYFLGIAGIFLLTGSASYFAYARNWF